MQASNTIFEQRFSLIEMQWCAHPSSIFWYCLLMCCDQFSPVNTASYVQCMWRWKIITNVNCFRCLVGMQWFGESHPAYMDETRQALFVAVRKQRSRASLSHREIADDLCCFIIGRHEKMQCRNVWKKENGSHEEKVSRDSAFWKCLFRKVGVLDISERKRPDGLSDILFTNSKTTDTYAGLFFAIAIHSPVDHMRCCHES